MKKTSSVKTSHANVRFNIIELGVWLYIMPGLPTHLMQELNVGTVLVIPHSKVKPHAAGLLNVGQPF